MGIVPAVRAYRAEHTTVGSCHCLRIHKLATLARIFCETFLYESTILVVVEVDNTGGDELVLVVEVLGAPIAEEVVLGSAVDVELLGPVGLGGMMLLVVVDELLLTGVLEELVVGGVKGSAGDPELLATTDDELDGGASG